METIMEPTSVQPKFKAKSGLKRKSIKHGRGEGLNTAPGSPIKSLLKPKIPEKTKIIENDNTPMVPDDDIANKRAKTLKKFKQSGGTGEVMPDVPNDPTKRLTKLKSPRKLRKGDVATEEPGAKVSKPGPVASIIRTKSPKKLKEVQDYAAKYPVLSNEVLVQQFLKVPMSNNQKGRIRQAIKESLLGTSNAVVPSIVHSKIQAILRSSPNLTDSQLRRVRILFNLLKTSLNGEQIVEEPTKKLPPAVDVVTQVSEKLRKRKSENPGSPVKEGDSKIKKEQLVQKVRGPKRYIVFLGNLPLNVDKEMIMAHFSEMNEHIVNVRIPKPRVDKKSTIAYVELSNEASYEFALSKHHSMLGKKRINVLYTTQKNGKVSKADAKSKSAKLIALQKSGRLVGSIPLAKRRSQRRLKHKQALAKINE